MRLLSLNSGAIKIEGRATPWNKGKLLGQKPPLKLKEVTVRRRVIASDWSLRKFEFGTPCLGSGKASSGTRIARLEGIDNTYVST